MFGKSKEPTGGTQMFVVYDSKTGIYDLPSPAENKEDMIRAVLNLFRSPQGREHRYYVNAEDFSMFFIGTYYKKTGEFLYETPKHCVNFHELRSLVTTDFQSSPQLVNSMDNSPTSSKDDWRA